MTTAAAANLYIAQHLVEEQYKGNAVFNPHGKPVGELPTIYESTILARIISGDPSAGNPTSRQQEWADWLVPRLGKE